MTTGENDDNEEMAISWNNHVDTSIKTYCYVIFRSDIDKTTNEANTFILLRDLEWPDELLYSIRKDVITKVTKQQARSLWETLVDNHSFEEKPYNK